jgi:predicted transcriptional regulator
MIGTFRHNPELHVNVLHTFASHVSLRISNLKSKAKIDGSTLNKHLEFLVQNGLIEKRQKNKTTALYANTEQGQPILNWFSEPTHIQYGGLSMINRKELRGIRNKIERTRNPVKKRHLMREYEVLLETMKD